MIVKIDGQEYQVNDNEFIKIPHDKFTNQQKPNVIMYKNGVNFNIKGSEMVSDYLALVNRALNECMRNTNYFVNNYKPFLDK